MVREIEGAVFMARQCDRRRRRRSADAVREEERPGGPCGPKGRIGRRVAGLTGPKFEGKFLSE
jgi:hypothetical protein